MIELIKYFRIMFMSTRISRDRLRAFTEDHIQRLTANNPGGIFTTILTDVTNAYNAFAGDLASKSLNEAVKEGKTIALTEAHDALEKQISENESLVRYTYRNNNPFYEEFYPLGITEYHDAGMEVFATITLRYRTVLANHNADFPAQFVTDYNTLYGTFVTNRNAQSTAKSAVSSEISDLAATRPALAKQLTVDLLTISLEYIGDESKADVYFDQAILDAAFRESERKVTSEINPGETQNVFDNITKGDLMIAVKNNGEDVINIAFKNAADVAVAAGEHPVNPGQEISLNAAEFGWTSENKFLNVTNNGALAGSYTVEKV